MTAWKANTTDVPTPQCFDTEPGQAMQLLLASEQRAIYAYSISRAVNTPHSNPVQLLKQVS
jgi:hypothetical protein